MHQHFPFTAWSRALLTTPNMQPWSMPQCPVSTHTRDSHSAMHTNRFYERSANILTQWFERVVSPFFFRVFASTALPSWGIATIHKLCLSHSLADWGCVINIFFLKIHSSDTPAFLLAEGWGCRWGVKSSKGRQEVGVLTVTVQACVWWARLMAWTSSS